MCGRYALSLRAAVVRQRLADQDMPVDDAPDDDSVRPSYNFAPGYHGLIYRAQTSDRGASTQESEQQDDNETDERPTKRTKTTHPTNNEQHDVDGLATKETKYKLQAAKWGLVPFWTKRPPDYGSQLRTINCRDDSLAQSGGMWNTMKQRKRCIVVAEGFYEWLKKNNGKEKIPHFVKRKDGELMCFAGLWDMVQYEGSEEKLYTYTIITTDSNAQLKFLHDRMPVILEAGSENMKMWLDPKRVGWDRELQQLLKPFQGELECYPVDQGVGKVGNNSPQFVIPVDSKENKKNIANFFGNQAKLASPQKQKEKVDIKQEQEQGEDRETIQRNDGSENNAPLPKPEGQSTEKLEESIKKEASTVDDDILLKAEDELNNQSIERDVVEVDDKAMLEATKSPPTMTSPKQNSPAKKAAPGTKKGRDPTSNHTVAKTPTKEGNTRITAFFGK